MSINLNERLSANFTLGEYINSPTATREKIYDQFNPPANIIANIRRINVIMQTARNMFGKPISIGSGYRCKRLNTLVGGATRSEHLDALGVDIPIRNYSQDETIRLIEIFISLGVKRIGLANTFIHVGFSTDRPQNVVFDYTGARQTPKYLADKRSHFLRLMK